MQQRLTQPVAKMSRDPSDERDLLIAEVRLVFDTDHGDVSPGRPARAEHPAQFGAAAERVVQVSVARTAAGLAVRVAVQRAHRDAAGGPL